MLALPGFETNIKKHMMANRCWRMKAEGATKNQLKVTAWWNWGGWGKQFFQTQTALMKLHEPNVRDKNNKTTINIPASGQLEAKKIHAISMCFKAMTAKHGQIYDKSFHI